MIVFRLSKRRHSKDISGRGAELYGGRWNSKGIGMLYTCQSKALATVEVAVHVPAGIIPSDYYMVDLEMPPGVAIHPINPATLPGNWKTSPDVTRKIGNSFINTGKYLALKVPSATVEGEYNYLINPMHAGISKIKIVKAEPFTFDYRLFRR